MWRLLRPPRGADRAVGFALPPSQAQLVPNHAFGIKADVRDNICYLDEQTVLFPAGSNIVIYSMEQKLQRFIPGTEKAEAQSAGTRQTQRHSLCQRLEPVPVAVGDRLHAVELARVPITEGPRRCEAPLPPLIIPGTRF